MGRRAHGYAGTVSQTLLSDKKSEIEEALRIKVEAYPGARLPPINSCLKNDSYIIPFIPPPIFIPSITPSTFTSTTAASVVRNIAEIDAAF